MDTQINFACPKKLKDDLNNFERAHRSRLKKDLLEHKGRPAFRSEILRRAIKMYMEHVTKTGQL